MAGPSLWVTVREVGLVLASDPGAGRLLIVYNLC